MNEVEFLKAYGNLQPKTAEVLCFILEHGSKNLTQVSKGTQKNIANTQKRLIFLVNIGVLLYNGKEYCMAEEWKNALIKWNHADSESIFENTAFCQ